MMARLGPTVPTPRSSDARGPGPSNTDNLVGLLKAGGEGGLFPSPTAADGERSTERYYGKNLTLPGAARLWPSPSAAGTAGETSPDLERRGAKLANRRTGRTVQTALSTEVRMEEAGLWPTPTVQDAENLAGPSQWGRHSDPLNVAVVRADAGTFPTPKASDGDGRGGQAKRMEGRRRNLVDAVAMWPTPDAAWSGPDYARATRDGSGADDLQTAVAKDDLASYPTPRGGARGVGMQGGRGHERKLKGIESSGRISSAERSAMSAGGGGTLNPTWVSWLMGFPLTWLHASPEETAKEIVRSVEFWRRRIETMDGTDPETAERKAALLDLLDRDPLAFPVPRIVTGIPRRVAKLRGLGNAVLPQVAEAIGICIRAADEEGLI
jgi:hypothetical protein